MTAILCSSIGNSGLQASPLLSFDLDILSNNQYWFQNGRNCEHILAKFYNFFGSNLDNSKDCNLVDGIFLEFSAAFERVDHSGLFHKIHNYGIRGNMLLC